MNYSTLQEAYNIDTFEKKSKPSQKSNKNGAANGVGSFSPSSNTNHPTFVETSKLALSSNKVSDYPNNGGSCSPIQAPTYNIPISNECKKDHDDAMNVYLNATNNNNNPTMNVNKPSQVSPMQSTQAPLASSMSGSANSLNSTNSMSSTNSTSLFTNIKSSNENVMPYYDEDLEQYFNINNLNDEVKYNSNSYMPNTNKQSYANNDTSEYANVNNVPKNGNNLLNNSGYNLTPEEKKSAEDAIMFLKSIEDKINNGNINSSGYNKTSILDPVITPENTGSGGFKTPSNNNTEKTDKTEKPDKTDKEEKQKKQDRSDTTYIYNAIFNISILLIIGIAIILLCDQIVELAIQIGMKRAVNILEPLIKNQIRAQELANNI